mmetsp:Transcript_48684/g.155563  ORF Transcript_48684/g.155563 Transcript_48684/m.155563 type:complete len:311 (+) Transcript_48684:579-1511(+)
MKATWRRIPLSASSCTFLPTLWLKKGCPLLKTSTAPCTFLRPESSICMAAVKPSAKLAKPHFCCRPSMPAFALSMSSVSSTTLSAGVMVPPAPTSPLPYSTTPTRMPSAPWYCGRTRSTISAARTFSVLKPLTPQLPSTMMTRSRAAAHSSSPAQFCVLHGSLASLSGADGFAHLPSGPRMGSNTPRFRCREPPPQAAEHAPQDDHFESTQSRLQDSVPHDRSSCTELHGRPPCLGCVMVKRVLACTPPPHCFVHLENGDHSDTTQSTGHLTWLQRLFRMSDGQRAPNSFGATISSRVNSWMPPHSHGFG